MFYSTSVAVGLLLVLVLHVLMKRKRLKHAQIQTRQHTTESNTYQSIPPQGTSDIVIGMELLGKEK